MNAPDDVPLLHYIDARIADLAEQVAIEIRALRKMRAADLAALDERLSKLNEFRAVLSDEQRTLITRSEYLTQHQGLVERVEQVEQAQDRRIAALEASLAAVQGRLIGLVGLGALFGGTIVAAIQHFLGGK